MEAAKKLEVTLAGWYKQVPFHLPLGGRKWLSENVWWIVLIGVVASALSIISSIRAYMWAEQVSRQYHDLAVYYGVGPSANDPLNMAALWFGVLCYAAIIVLEAMAISPLKVRQKKGWDLLFFAMLIGALSSVVTAVLLTSIGSLLGAAIGLAVGGYFLFEIHENFSVTQATQKTKPAKAAKKS